SSGADRQAGLFLQPTHRRGSTHKGQAKTSVFRAGNPRGGGCYGCHVGSMEGSFPNSEPTKSPAFHKADQRRSRQVRPDGYRRLGTILATDARFGSSTTSIIYAIGHDISSVSEDGSFSRKILSIDDNEGGGEARLLPSDFRPTGGFFDLLSLIP